MFDGFKGIKDGVKNKKQGTINNNCLRNKNNK